MSKQFIYRLISKNSHGSKANLVFNYSIMTLILLNVLAMALETVSSLDNSYYRFLKFFEIISVIIFTIEYALRIYISDLTHPASNRIKSALKFIFSFYGLIDLLAITPFYFPFFIKTDLRILRILRLVRFLRILKINRYDSSINLVWEVIKEKKSELAITGFITFLVLLIASFVMYYVEKDVQPDKFSNIFASFWWATATLTTIGYGDIYPVTYIGKIISGLIAFLGIGIVALPTGLVSAGFMEKIQKKKLNTNQCPHCGKEIEI